MEGRDTSANRVHDTDALVPEDTSRSACRNVAREDMKVGAADCCLNDLYDSVARILNGGFLSIFDNLGAGAAIYECAHGILLPIC
jgi:hypothetical protein